MAYTSTNPIVVVKNGTLYRLDTFAYNISTKGGIAGKMAALRGESITTSGRDGTLYRRGRTRDEKTIVLSMWAKDSDVNDAGTPSYEVWRNNMDFLLWLFDTSSAQIEIREYTNVPISAGVTLTGYSFRRATCEVSSAIDPDYLGRSFGKFSVELVNNSAFWEDGADSTFTSPIGTTSVGTHTATPFAGASAPMKDLMLQVTGPLTNARVTDTRTGHYVQLNMALPAGQQWLVDCATWRSVTGASLNFATSGGTNQTLLTQSSGVWAPKLFALSAHPTTPQVALAGTGATSTTKLEIKGRREFH